LKIGLQSFVWFVGVLVLAASLVIGWYWMDYRKFTRAPLDLPGDGLIYTVPSGAGTQSIARDLQRMGVLREPLYFRLLVRETKQGRNLRAGEYRLEPGLTPHGLIELLVSGKSVGYSLTLVEGWSFKQFRAALAADPVLIQTLDDVSDDELMKRLGLDGLHPEGQFFPDTYRFPRGTEDLDVLRRAHRRMQDVLQKVWAERDEDLPINTPYEAQILASIIEKETGAAEERRQIAGVFVRRLRLGMRLQTDPTVIYGMGDRFDGNIRRKDLSEDTPYNTYVRTGLPPTPICMPGEAALRAAVDPADGKALYFVARGDGTHQFSDSLKAHNAAVRRYQLKRGK
jgi:UPF0755 protein